MLANLPLSLDIDECTDNFTTFLCDEFATCINTEGSATCMCVDGYTGNGQEFNCEGIVAMVSTTI